MPPSRPPRDPLLWALLALAAVHLAWLAPRLVGWDLNWDYPFLDGDSGDWLANGLWWAGAPVRFSARTPLVPLLLAACARLGILGWWPLVPVVAVHAAALGLYAALRGWTGRVAAAAAVLAVAGSFAVQGMARDLMADSLAAALGAVALALLLGVPARPSRLLPAAGLAGLAAIAQLAGLLLAPALLLAALRSRTSRGRALAATLLFVAPTLAWAAFERLHFGAFADVPASQWSVLGLDASSTATFLWLALSLVGAPLALLVLGGLATALRRLAVDARAGIAAAAFLAPAGFFALLYAYPAKRLLLYAAWPGAALAALALARLPRVPRLVGGALALAAAGLPLGEPAHLGARAALWPAPPLELSAPLHEGSRGAPRADLAAIALRRPARGELLPGPPPARAPGARDSAAAATDRAVLYVASPREEARRYPRQAQVGNALRRRALWLRGDLYAPCLARFASAPAGALRDGTALARLRTDAMAGAWLAAFAADTPEAAALAPQPAVAFDAGAARGARSIVAAAGGAARLVLVLPAAPPAAACLVPLVVTRADLHLVAAGDAGEARFLDALPGEPERGLDGAPEARGRRVRAFGASAFVVRFADPPPG